MSTNFEKLLERLERVEAKQQEQNTEHLRLKREIERIDNLSLSELDFKIMHDFVFKMARMYEQFYASNDAPRCSLIFPDGTSGALNKGQIPQVERWNFCVDYSLAANAMGREGKTPYHTQRLKLYIGVMHHGKGVRKCGCEEMGLRRDYAQKLWQEAIEFLYFYLEEYDWRRVEQKEEAYRLEKARKAAADYFGAGLPRRKEVA